MVSRVSRSAADLHVCVFSAGRDAGLAAHTRADNVFQKMDDHIHEPSYNDRLNQLIKEDGEEAEEDENEQESTERAENSAEEADLSQGHSKLIGNPRPKYFFRKGAQQCAELYACLGCARLLAPDEHREHKNRGCDKDKDPQNISFSDLPKRHNGTFCAECLAFVPTLRMLARHFEEAHNLVAPVKEVHIRDDRDFEEFMNWMQQQGGIKIVNMKQRLSRDRTRTYRFFGCCLVAKPKDIRENSRRASLKSLLSCTAYARTIPQDDGTVVVEYCTVHSHGFIEEPKSLYKLPGTSVPFLTGHRPCSPPREDPPVGDLIDEYDSQMSNKITVANSKVVARGNKNKRSGENLGTPRPKRRVTVKSEPMDYDESVSDINLDEEDLDGENDHVPVSSRKVDHVLRKNPIKKATATNGKGQKQPLEQVRDALETIFSRLSALPEEMLDHFVPIICDLADDATDVYEKFEELRRFRPKRSLRRMIRGTQ
ncbi:unnamed protein product [Caenorhabditis auriculariae]|uniref:C2H2-type domain-containing protein n=1 Tax=Caenorhabditis auriculariae TaxID=2777116 RepID=A0A8S1GM64_9PELO|nr:unnamed protein product [Caenorhabditis auriculariae]